MAASRQHPLYWREAASLILARASPQPSHSTNRAPRSTTQNADCNIESLMVKRGKSSSFMPNVYVFPGGVVSDGDFNRERWGRLFEKATGRPMTEIFSHFHVPGPKVPMMQPSSTDILPLEIGFRLTAIRETFEECGMFVSLPGSEVRDRVSRGGLGSLRASRVTACLSGDSRVAMETWRRRVSEDPAALLTLCEEYDVVPDIWGLWEWCNWLTPVFEIFQSPPKKPKRFDTVFYCCCVEYSKHGDIVSSDAQEVSDVKWQTAREWLQLADDKKITLITPQLTETSRLSTFRETPDLLEYIRWREPLGLLRYMSVNILCKDGVVFALPGDDLYPDQPDYEGIRPLTEIQETVEETFQRSKNLHRGVREFKGMYCNIKLPYGLLTAPSARTVYQPRQHPPEPNL